MIMDLASDALGSWALGRWELSWRSASARAPLPNGRSGAGPAATASRPRRTCRPSGRRPRPRQARGQHQVEDRDPRPRPLVAGRLAATCVFVTTSIKGEQVPGRKAPVHLDFQKTPGYVHPGRGRRRLQAHAEGLRVDAKTGKVAWERTAYDGVMFDDRHRKNTFASSTMVTDGERAYAFFESAGLYAYDFKGKLVWKKDLGGIIKAGLGPGTSPIIYKDLIILQCDQEMGDGSYIVALEPQDRRRSVAREPRRTAGAGRRRSSSTPATRDELIASGAEVGDRLRPGDRQGAVAAERHAEPSDSEPGHDEGPRVPDRRQLGQGRDGDEARRQRRTEGLEGTVMWRYNKGAAYVPSPIAIGDYLYLLTDAGLMTCIDARHRRAQVRGRTRAGARRRSSRRRSRSTTRSC